MAKNIVGDAEGLEEAGVLGDGQEFFVGDHDGGIDRFHEFGDAALRLLHAAFAFKGKRLGHDGDGERAHFAGEGGNDRRRARAGAATESGGDENHVGTFEDFNDLVRVFERGFAADLGIGARAQSVGQLHSELNLGGGARHPQRLQVGVGDDEFDVFHARVNHAIDGVVAAAADTDDLDASVVAGFFVEADAESVVFSHTSPRKISCQFSVVSSQ